MVVMIEINSKGEQSKEALFSGKEAEVIMRPKVSEQVTNKELILFGERKKTHQFAKLIFK